MSAATEFKEFVLRGNVVDLAVGVVIGAAFGAVVTAFVSDIVTPLIAVPGKVDFGMIQYRLGGGTFMFGHFLNVLISFVLIALVVFFLVVKPVNFLMTRRKTDTATAPVVKECPRCLSSVPELATRCAFCTSDI